MWNCIETLAAVFKKLQIEPLAKYFSMRHKPEDVKKYIFVRFFSDQRKVYMQQLQQELLGMKSFLFNKLQPTGDFSIFYSELGLNRSSYFLIDQAVGFYEVGVFIYLFGHIYSDHKGNVALLLRKVFEKAKRLRNGPVVNGDELAHKDAAAPETNGPLSRDQIIEIFIGKSKPKFSDFKTAAADLEKLPPPEYNQAISDLMPRLLFFLGDLKTLYAAGENNERDLAFEIIKSRYQKTPKQIAELIQSNIDMRIRSRAITPLVMMSAQGG